MAKLSEAISLGTFDYNDTAAGGARNVGSAGVGPWTVYAITADSYDDTVAIEISPDGTNWVTHTSGIAADGKYTISDVFSQIRGNPTGGGSVGTVTLILIGITRD